MGKQCRKPLWPIGRYIRLFEGEENRRVIIIYASSKTQRYSSQFLGLVRSHSTRNSSFKCVDAMGRDKENGIRAEIKIPQFYELEIERSLCEYETPTGHKRITSKSLSADNVVGMGV
jgi:hypothetical protein